MPTNDDSAGTAADTTEEATGDSEDNDPAADEAEPDETDEPADATEEIRGRRRG